MLCPLLWVTLLGQGVGLGDPQRALPTPAMLGFCENSDKEARNVADDGGEEEPPGKLRTRISPTPLHAHTTGLHTQAKDWVPTHAAPALQAQTVKRNTEP